MHVSGCVQVHTYVDVSPRCLSSDAIHVVVETGPLSHQ